MPRVQRARNPEGVYHVMARSIPEFNLFSSDEDKTHFLDLLQICKEKYHCRVYAYCVMTNHYHILLDMNGYDISKFMKVLNLRYVKYVNKVYKRRGHLLDERFSSKVVEDTEGVLSVSSYIHNNAKDLPGYANRICEYKFSSMGIYTGNIEDKRNMIDQEFILGTINEDKREKAVTAYTEMVLEKGETGINQKLKKYMEEFRKAQYEYKSYRKILFRDRKPDELIQKIALRYGFSDTLEIMNKWNRNSMVFREVVAYALTTLCGMGTKEVCEYMKNITGTCLARLKEKGFFIFKNDKELMKLLEVH